MRSDPLRAARATLLRLLLLAVVLVARTHADDDDSAALASWGYDAGTYLPVSWADGGSYLSATSEPATPLAAVAVAGSVFLLGGAVRNNDSAPPSSTAAPAPAPLTWFGSPPVGTLRGTVLRSDDGGESWRRVGASALLERYGGAAFAVDADEARALPPQPAATRTPTATSSPTRTPSPTVTAFTGRCNLLCVAGGSAANASATLASSQARQYAALSSVACSRDGGVTWSVAADALPFPLYGATPVVVGTRVWLVGGLAVDLSSSTGLPKDIASKIPLVHGDVDLATCTVHDWEEEADLQDDLPGGPRLGMVASYAADSRTFWVGGGWKVSSSAYTARPVVADVSRDPYTDLWSSPYTFLKDEPVGVWTQVTAQFPPGLDASPVQGGLGMWEISPRANVTGVLNAVWRSGSGAAWTSSGPGNGWGYGSGATPWATASPAPGTSTPLPPAMLLLRSGGATWVTFDEGQVWFPLGDYALGSWWATANPGPAVQHVPNAGNRSLQLRLPAESAPASGGGLAVLVYARVPIATAALYDNSRAQVLSVPILVAANTSAGATFGGFFDFCRIADAAAAAGTSCGVGSWRGCGASPWDGACRPCTRCDGLVVGSGASSWPVDTAAAAQCGAFSDAVCRGPGPAPSSAPSSPTPTGSVSRTSTATATASAGVPGSASTTPSRSPTPSVSASAPAASASTTPTVAAAAATRAATASPSSLAPASPFPTPSTTPTVAASPGSRCDTSTLLPPSQRCAGGFVSFVQGAGGAAGDGGPTNNNGGGGLDTYEGSAGGSGGAGGGVPAGAGSFGASGTLALQGGIATLATGLLLSALVQVVGLLRRAGVASLTRKAAVAPHDTRAADPHPLLPRNPIRILLAHVAVMWGLLHAAYAIQLAASPVAAGLRGAGYAIGVLAVLAFALPVALALVLSARARAALPRCGGPLRSKAVGSAVAGSPASSPAPHSHLPALARFWVAVLPVAEPIAILDGGSRRRGLLVSGAASSRAVAASSTHGLGRAIAAQLLLIYAPLVVLTAATVGGVAEGGGWGIPGTACAFADAALCVWGVAGLAMRLLVIHDKHTTEGAARAADQKRGTESEAWDDVDEFGDDSPRAAGAAAAQDGHHNLRPVVVTQNPLGLGRRGVDGGNESPLRMSFAPVSIVPSSSSSSARPQPSSSRSLTTAQELVPRSRSLYAGLPLELGPGGVGGGGAPASADVLPFFSLQIHQPQAQESLPQSLAARPLHASMRALLATAAAHLETDDGSVCGGDGLDSGAARRPSRFIPVFAANPTLHLPTAAEEAAASPSSGSSSASSSLSANEAAGGLAGCLGRGASAHEDEDAASATDGGAAGPSEMGDVDPSAGADLETSSV
jgi:hypothetical protein